MPDEIPGELNPPARVLLGAGLLATPRDLASGLGGGGPFAGVRLLGHHHLVHQRLVHRDAEDIVADLDVPDDLPLCVAEL